MIQISQYVNHLIFVTMCRSHKHLNFFLYYLDWPQGGNIDLDPLFHSWKETTGDATTIVLRSQTFRLTTEGLE